MTLGQGAWESLKKLQEVNGGTRSTETLDMKFFVVIALAGFMQLMLFTNKLHVNYLLSCSPVFKFFIPGAAVASPSNRNDDDGIILHKCLRTMQCPPTKRTQITDYHLHQHSKQSPSTLGTAAALECNITNQYHVYKITTTSYLKNFNIRRLISAQEPPQLWSATSPTNIMFTKLQQHHI